MVSRRFGLQYTLLGLFCLSGCGADLEPIGSTLVITNAVVWTGDPDKPWAEAVAVDGDRITSVGSVDDVSVTIGTHTRVVDANGGMLVPGFIDTHVHFLDGGTVLSSVQLRDAGTPEEFTRRIGEFAEGIEPGEWILGGTWDHQLWGGELPRRDWIDDVTPNNPVWIQRLDGHMALANSLALAAGGVDADTPDVAGGVIERYDDGRWAEDYIGPERIKTTYAFRSLIDAGAHLAFGSDWTVAPATPLEGIYAAVTRRTIDGANPDGWVPEQKITVEEALRAYTYEGAYASFEENVKGTIKDGMLADLVLLDRNITTIDPNTIPDTNVLMTIIGGRVVFEAAANDGS